MSDLNVALLLFSVFCISMIVIGGLLGTFTADKINRDAVRAENDVEYHKQLLRNVIQKGKEMPMYLMTIEQLETLEAYKRQLETLEGE